ncbi:MAG: hypothetical protein JW862_06710 [Anaerolineales bacterium]|nr:hypothetical protein [Anaerolineales bacterium]
MKHTEILKRAWNILWSYKTLWIFGLLLAMTTATSSTRILEFSSPGQGQQQPITIDPGREIGQQVEDAIDELQNIFNQTIPPEVSTTLIIIGVVLACLALILILLRVILRFVSETALIRMVDDYEASGEKRNWKEGFRSGWSRLAGRLFLINLVVNIPAMILFVVYMLLALLPLFLWADGNMTAGIIGTVSTIGLFFLGIFLAILVGALLQLFKRFFFRAAALEDQGVLAALRRGLALVRQNWREVGLMWLLTVGIHLGFAIVMIPVAFLVLVLAAMIGGIVFVTGAGITSLFGGSTLSGEELAIIVGVLTGLPVFFLTVLLPLSFLGGLLQTFLSSTWTLTYRELLAMEALANGNDPIEDPSEE